MKKVRLGKTGLMVSRVGMGGIPLTRPPLEEVIGFVNRALDLGVNFINTAFGYSDSEERIGIALEGRREEVVLATKSGASDRQTALKHLESWLEDKRKIPLCKRVGKK